jgi:hypothetical protein
MGGACRTSKSAAQLIQDLVRKHEKIRPRKRPMCLFFRLFCGAVSIPTICIASNDNVMKNDGLERLNGSGRPYLKYYPGICLEWLRKAMKSLGQISRCPGRYSNPEPLECVSAALPLHQLAPISNCRWKHRIKMDLMKINFDVVT